MIGLAYLVLGAIYVVAMACLVGWAWRQGRKLNRSVAIACATLAFLSLYLPVFWDFIPTVVAHRHYCAKDAGIVIAKDPQQWVQEHAAEVDELRFSINDPTTPKTVEQPDGWRRRMLNRRVAMLERWTKIGAPWTSIERLELRIVDTQTDATLVSLSDFRSGAALVSQTLRPQPNADSCKTPSLVLQMLDVISPLFLDKN